MIELKLCNVSENGKMYEQYFLFRDKHFEENDRIEDFLLKLTLRDALIIKGDIERLERMPIIYIDGKNKTEEYTPKLISSIEKYFGEMEYCQTPSKRGNAVKKYLQTNGVTI